MKPLKRYSKITRIVLGIILFFVIVAATIHLSFVFYFNNSIRKDLQKEFSRQTKGEYELVIDELNTNVLMQSVFIKEFSVRPVKGIRTDATKYHIFAKELNFVNFNLFRFLSGNGLEFHRLELATPSLTVFRNRVDDELEKDTIPAGEFSIYRLLKRHVRALSVDHIQVSNAEIKVYNNDRDSLLLIDSRHNRVGVTGLRIDEESERYGRLFLAEKTELAVHQFAFTTQDSLYTIKVAAVFASYTGSSVRMDSVEIVPNYSKREFARIAGEQTDRLKITVAEIEFSRMDVKLFFEKNWFIARHMKIKGLNLEAYRDKNDMRKPHTPLSVQALVKKIPVRVRIDTITVPDAVCIYEEIAEKAHVPGKIKFSQIRATITGLSNGFSPDGAGRIEVNATCRLMEKGRLRVHYGFPMNTEKMVFDCSGRLSGMPFTDMNKVLEPIARVSALQGEIDSMIFSFHAGEVSSDGSMKLAYHDLKIQILKRKDGVRDPAEHFLSFLAHSFVIRENNPTRRQPIRTAKIFYQRDPHRFIFNYSLKSLLSGIKETIGK